MRRDNIASHTNFDEISTFLKCPSRLFLKLSGYGSEVQRTNSPPSVSPALLGKQGEETIRSGFQKEAEVETPEIQKVPVDYPKVGLNEFVIDLTRIIRGNIKVILASCDAISATYTSREVSKVAQDLKKKFGVTAIIEQIGYTTVPHHFTGRIDFLGLKEDNDVVVIEAKNKAAKLSRDDALQLEYYMAGLSKQYQYTKIHEHTHELAAQLFPEKYLGFISYLKKVDLMEMEQRNSHDIILGGLHSLKAEDRVRFINSYCRRAPPALTNGDYEDHTKALEASKGFLSSIPECTQLSKMAEDYKNKASICENDFRETANRVAEIMSKGIKNGLLVDIRRQEIQDTPLQTDFDAVATGVWSVKKNVLNGQRVCTKNHDACSYCQLKNACSRVIIEEGELPRVASITSIAHKGFSQLSYEYKPHRENTFLWKGEVRATQIPAAISFRSKDRETSNQLTDAELLKMVLSQTEWGYQDWFPTKKGWKTLFMDALASKKLQLEFDFWKI